MAITEKEIEELVNVYASDTCTNIDDLLALIGKTNVNRNKKLDSANLKTDETNQKLSAAGLKIDSTNLKLDELINLSEGDTPTKDILPGDKGVSLAAANNGDITSCVINGIVTNAIAKEDIKKHTSIIVVPGGTSDEPYIVALSYITEIGIPSTIIDGTKLDISTTAEKLVTTSTPISKSVIVKLRSFGTGSYIAIGNSTSQNFRLTAVGDARDIDFVDDLSKVYVRTDVGNTGELEFNGA